MRHVSLIAWQMTIQAWIKCPRPAECPCQPCYLSLASDTDTQAGHTGWTKRTDLAKTRPSATVDAVMTITDAHANCHLHSTAIAVNLFNHASLSVPYLHFMSALFHPKVPATDALALHVTSTLPLPVQPHSHLQVYNWQLKRVNHVH